MKIPSFAIAAMTGLAMLLAALSSPAAAADGPVTFKDITGQTISLPHPAKRILLAEGRQIIAISLIHPDPVSVLAGWLGDMRRSPRAAPRQTPVNPAQGRQHHRRARWPSSRPRNTDRS